MTAVSTAPHAPRAAPSGGWVQRYDEVRAWTHALCAPLEIEDYVVRSMEDASPAKWHLAHTSWFYETFVLGPHLAGYVPRDPRYAFLFNSYYVQAGERHCRAQRGLVTRPTVAEVYAYRAHVDDAMRRLLARLDDGEPLAEVAELVTLGLNHEQQHQELILTDIKHAFWMNPLRPAYAARAEDGAAPAPAPAAAGWITHPGGIVAIGHDGAGFAFDNEGPRHQVLLQPFRVASRPVTNAEWLEFVRDGGYARPTLWLSAGWDAVRANGWEAPLYWERADDGWTTFTLAGPRALDPAEPVCHVSFFEADAFARWAGARLPTEAEWETVAPVPGDGAYAESRRFHPPRTGPAPHDGFWGSIWQWTASPYLGYPGYAPPTGAVGEYNGKFMADQWVLRGASVATPRSHARRTYRNFFPAPTRWQFAGVRLAAGA